MNRFVLFGPAHLGALAATAGVALALVAAARRASASQQRALRVTLAVLLLATTAVTVAYWWSRGLLSGLDLLPLHLCDFLIFVAAFALLARRALAAELLYFWAGTGTLLAMLAPDLRTGFPSWPFASFFGLHGLVLVAAAVVTFGLGMRPREGAPLRAFVALNAYAAAVGVVNLACDTNFLYLRRKPGAATLLDWLGPWPVYLLAAEALALGAFLLLDRPFRTSRRAIARSGTAR